MIVLLGLSCSLLPTSATSNALIFKSSGIDADFRVIASYAGREEELARQESDQSTFYYEFTNDSQDLSGGVRFLIRFPPILPPTNPGSSSVGNDFLDVYIRVDFDNGFPEDGYTILVDQLIDCVGRCASNRIGRYNASLTSEEISRFFLLGHLALHYRMVSKSSGSRPYIETLMRWMLSSSDLQSDRGINWWRIDPQFEGLMIDAFGEDSERVQILRGHMENRD
ncbi:hypothetical protein QTA57_08640 [Fontisubflavum oceani]|uniref:hypothetical protein n=1 Tax=Fontisubflavum oceani TaxID=2978973 RepID=UPI0025B28D53|nr:hypothetical protein [Fontisubflavum oceani]WJY23120.1 hypothetical protein QTA57_08640 [Fontisubflavum oceani]